MDPTGKCIEASIYIGPIVLWGLFEYREREIRHKKTLLDLQKNIEPKMGNPPNWTKVGTATGTAVVLLIVILFGAIFLDRIGIHYGSFVIVVLIEFLLLDLLLFTMAIRDTKSLRRG